MKISIGSFSLCIVLYDAHCMGELANFSFNFVRSELKREKIIFFPVIRKGRVIYYVVQITLEEKANPLAFL